MENEVSVPSSSEALHATLDGVKNERLIKLGNSNLKPPTTWNMYSESISQVCTQLHAELREVKMNAMVSTASTTKNSVKFHRMA